MEYLSLEYNKINFNWLRQIKLIPFIKCLFGDFIYFIKIFKYANINSTYIFLKFKTTTTLLQTQQQV